MDNENWYVNVRVYKRTLFSHKKKNEISPFVTTQMELEAIMPSETSQTEKDKYHMIILKLSQSIFIYNLTASEKSDCQKQGI